MPLGFGLGELIVFLFLPTLLVLPPAWSIVSKAGYPGVWSLVLLVPILNVVAFFIFAFRQWPLERRAAPPSV